MHHGDTEYTEFLLSFRVLRVSVVNIKGAAIFLLTLAVSLLSGVLPALGFGKDRYFS